MKHGRGESYWQFVERSGERPQDWQFRGFVCTRDRDEVGALTEEPCRWHLKKSSISTRPLAGSVPER